MKSIILSVVEPKVSCIKTHAKVRRLKGAKMASTRQKKAARKNIKKAAATAKRKRTIAHLPKSVRTALGKQAASVAKEKRRSSSSRSSR